jgi:hypothetical protein
MEDPSLSPYLMTWECVGEY